MTTLHVRRGLVVLGVLASLLAGAATIRAASLLTAASGPLQPPVAGSRVESQLEAAQARSISLQQQLSALNEQSTQLDDALRQAQTRAQQDAATAAGLRTRLKAAQARLATLSRSIQSATQPAAATPGTQSSPVSVPQGDDGGGDD